MDDEIGLIQCTDCNSVCKVGFMLVLRRDRVLQSFARCPFCFSQGDTRDLVGTVRLTIAEYLLAWNINILVREDLEGR